MRVGIKQSWMHIVDVANVDVANIYVAKANDRSMSCKGLLSPDCWVGVLSLAPYSEAWVANSRRGEQH